jgi:Zn-dependent protease with chaperone function
MPWHLWPVLVAAIENFILINTALCLFSFFIVWIIKTSKVKQSPKFFTTLYSSAIVAPPLFSTWIVISTFLPQIYLTSSQWAKEHQLEHNFHLLNAWTFPFDPTFAYITLLFLIVSLAIANYVLAKAYLTINKIVGLLEVSAKPVDSTQIAQTKAACQQSGLDVGLIISDYPFSFVWGYWKAKLVISTGLLNLLTSSELSVLLQHEVAHHQRQDNLSKCILTFCRYSSPLFPLTGIIYRYWSEQVELLCDEIAAQKTNAPIDIASALVKLKRVANSRGSWFVQPTESSFFGEDSSDFERRVERVLSITESSSVSNTDLLQKSWSKPIKMIGIGYVISLILLFWFDPLAIHHMLEIILTIF